MQDASKAIRIVKWNERHENAETRKVRGPLSWVVIPTIIKLSLRELFGSVKGLEVFGAYVVFVEVAATMPIRGVLANENGPLSPQQVAMLTGAAPKRLGAALDYLQAPPLNWMDQVEWPYAGPLVNGYISGRDDDPGGGVVGAEWEPPGSEPGASRAAPAYAHARPAAAAAAGRQAAGDARGNGDGLICDILARCQVPKSKIGECASVDGLTPERVVSLWAELREDKSVRRVGRVLAARLLEDGAHTAAPLSWSALSQGRTCGVIRAINGVAVKDLRVEGVGQVDGVRLVDPSGATVMHHEDSSSARIT